MNKSLVFGVCVALVLGLALARHHGEIKNDNEKIVESIPKILDVAARQLNWNGNGPNGAPYPPQARCPPGYTLDQNGVCRLCRSCDYNNDYYP